MIFVVLLLLSLPDQVPSQSQYKAENSKYYLEKMFILRLSIAVTYFIYKQQINL